jgi:hypothetical protein
MSTWNGFKLMPPNVKKAILHSDRTFPANVHGSVPGNPQEQALVFHDLGQGRMVPGQLNVGTEGSVQVPRDIKASTAKVYVHQHPYTGVHLHNEPSMNDHLVARAFPNVQHIVQIPARHRIGSNPYITYSGAVPPRFYTLVENPFNLEVPPPSPDRHGILPYHPRP